MSDFFEFVRGAAIEAGYDIDSPRSGARSEFAKAVGMSLSSTGRMFSGKTIPELRFLPAVAGAVGVPADELIRLAGAATAGLESDQPVLPLSAELFAKIRTLRKIHGVSAQELADRMTAQGFEISRSVIANCESGRVRSLSVDQAEHAARALGTTLPLLVTDPANCPQCKGEPPAGFTCNTCGGA